MATKSKIIVLRIPSEHLAAYAPAQPIIKHEEVIEKSPDSNDTPVPSNPDVTDPNSLAPPKPDAKKKKGGGPAVAGRKRAPPSIDPNAPPREKGRPGPKKKPRLPDGTIDRSAENLNGPPRPANPPPAHKLGPKANTGAINAGLRALDRSGKPCRRWGKKPTQVKSFTGAMWAMGSWKAPLRDQGFPGDVKSDSASSSDVKQNHESSAVQSERSHSHVDAGDDTFMTGMQSSPAPAVAAA